MVDCDKLGHLAYAVGTPGHAQVVAAFGQQVVAADGSIDRKALGAVVFSDAVKVGVWGLAVMIALCFILASLPPPLLPPDAATYRHRLAGHCRHGPPGACAVILRV